MRGVLREAVTALLGMVAVWPLMMTPLEAQELVIDGAPVITVLPRDAIPAIDKPNFVPVSEAMSFMREEEQVLGLAEGKEAKAYSTWLLNHHEIVNDTLGGKPVAVTW